MNNFHVRISKMEDKPSEFYIRYFFGIDMRDVQSCKELPVRRITEWCGLSNIDINIPAKND